MDSLLCSDDDGIRLVTLNRPERRNAMNSVLAIAFIDALRQADLDNTVRAMVIGGHGKSFCAGADLSEFSGEHADPAAQEKRSDLFLELQLLFDEIDVPIIAAVEGPAIGMGASIAIAADLTVMGESGRLGFPEIAHGMLPSLVMGHLQHRTTRKHAFELLSLPASLPAAEALSRGLVNRVVPDGTALAEAMEIARTLAGHDRTTMRRTKRLFLETCDMPLGAGLRAARDFARKR